MAVHKGLIHRFTSILLVTMVLMSGCGSNQDRNDPGETTPGFTPTLGDAVTLNIWVPEQEDTFLPQLIEAFELEHPNIDVVITEIAEEKYAGQLTSAFLEWSGPDIAQVTHQDWLISGFFLPIDISEETYRVPYEDFNAGAITRNCIFNDRVYCIGSLTSGTILVYNKDLFDLFKAPYLPADEPLSMQEYYDLVARLTQKSDKIEERIWGGDALPPVDWIEPGTHVSPDGRAAKGYLNDEPTSRAYQWMADLYQTGSVMTVEETELVKQDSLALLVANRQATALVDSSRAMPVLEQSGIRWGAAIVPTEQKGDPKWTSNRTDGLGVSSRSLKSNAAMQFLVFLAHRGSQIRLERGEMPLNMRLAEQWAAGSDERRQIFAALKHGRAYPFIPGFTEMNDLVRQAWEDMILEGIPAKVALDEITGPLQAVLDQNWAEFEAIYPPDS